jgi:transposase
MDTPSCCPRRRDSGIAFHMRQRERLVTAAGVQQMQQALTEMNVQLANVISDISGKTGLAILRALVNGERDPQVLSKFRH